MSNDPTSQANYLQIISEHLAFDWTLNFDKKIVQGSVTHTLRALEDDVKELM